MLLGTKNCIDLSFNIPLSTYTVLLADIKISGDVNDKRYDSRGFYLQAIFATFTSNYSCHYVMKSLNDIIFTRLQIPILCQEKENRSSRFIPNIYY